MPKKRSTTVRKTRIPLTEENSAALTEVSKRLQVGPARCRVILSTYVNRHLAENGIESIFREHFVRQLGE